MNTRRMELMPGVFLTHLYTEKFRTNCLSVSLLCPLNRDEAAKNALLPDVLLRGCRICPDMAQNPPGMLRDGGPFCRESPLSSG